MRWPLSCAVIDPENASLLGNDPIRKYMRRSADNTFAGSWNTPDASAAREPGEQFGLFVNAPFDEFRSSLAFHSDISRQLVQVTHGCLAPDKPHAMAFNFRAFRIA